jgi:thioredoxin 1
MLANLGFVLNRYWNDLEELGLCFIAGKIFTHLLRPYGMDITSHRHSVKWRNPPVVRAVFGLSTPRLPAQQIAALNMKTFLSSFHYRFMLFRYIRLIGNETHGESMDGLTQVAMIDNYFSQWINFVLIRTIFSLVQPCGNPEARRISQWVSGEEADNMTSTVKSPLELTTGNFEQEVLRSKLVMVEFWSKWSGACRVMGYVLEDFLQEVGDIVTVAKLDVDEHPEIAAHYGLQSIPNILIFKDGRVMDRIVGAVPKKVLAQHLAALTQPSW